MAEIVHSNHVFCWLSSVCVRLMGQVPSPLILKGANEHLLLI